MQTVNASSALVEEADEARLGGLHQRATHGVGDVSESIWSVVP
jgi:hypothetical protein